MQNEKDSVPNIGPIHFSLYNSVPTSKPKFAHITWFTYDRKYLTAYVSSIRKVRLKPPKRNDIFYADIGRRDELKAVKRIQLFHANIYLTDTFLSLPLRQSSASRSICCTPCWDYQAVGTTPLNHAFKVPHRPHVTNILYLQLDIITVTLKSQGTTCHTRVNTDNVTRTANANIKFRTFPEMSGVTSAFPGTWSIYEDGRCNFNRNI